MEPTLRRDSGTKTFPAQNCSLCGTVPTNHYCVAPDNNGAHVFEHNEEILRRCGKAICTLCREKYNYESRIYCPFHAGNISGATTNPPAQTPAASTTAIATPTDGVLPTTIDFTSPSITQPDEYQTMFSNTPRDNKTPAQPTSRKSGHKRKAEALKKKGTVRIGKGKRVMITRQKLYNILDGRNDGLTNYLSDKNGNSYMYFGTVIDKVQNNGKKWLCEFDILPKDDDGVTYKIIVARNNLEPITVECEKELSEVNEECMHDEVESIINNKKKKKSAKTESIDSFLAKGDDFLKTAKEYKHIEETDNRNYSVDYKILQETEHIEEDDFEFPSPPELNFGDADLSDPTTLRKLFFDRIFCDIKGHGAIMDRYLRDDRCSIKKTAVDKNITFHDPTHEDPDWKVKLCYWLMISATTENVTGAESLWKRGKSQYSRHSYPDYGQYVTHDTFKCFKAAAPYAFSDEKDWFKGRRDGTWRIFTPALMSYNHRRQSFYKNAALAVLLDESMSGFCPKTSKTGGYPNITKEPRKPVSLGTLIRNAAEAYTGVLIFQDVQMQSELQYAKSYSSDSSNMPDKAPLSSATAEVLRQIQGAKLAPEKSWVGGDAWFGSVTTAVEAKKIHNVDSTWIVKNNTKWYPKKILFAILKARHGDNIAGNWVVMTSTISGVKLFVCAYAWSQSSVSYFVSTCGKTLPSQTKYISKFEDEHGGVGNRALNRPSFTDYFFNYCPVIDEHNKSRQYLLHLEKIWKTHDCWFRLLTTLLAQSVVDLQRLSMKYIADRSRHNLPFTEIMDLPDDESDCDDDLDHFFKIRKFADMLTSNLDDYKRSRPIDAPVSAVSGEHLERITDNDGNTTRKPTDKQMREGRTSRGSAIMRSCYVCRLWDYPKNTQMTSWRCKHCLMPLCKKKAREGEKFCLETHREAKSNEHWKCTYIQSATHTVPENTRGQWKYNKP